MTRNGLILFGALFGLYSLAVLIGTVVVCGEDSEQCQGAESILPALIPFLIAAIGLGAAWVSSTRRGLIAVLALIAAVGVSIWLQYEIAGHIVFLSGQEVRSSG